MSVGQVIGEVLSPAIGIALSPVPIIAAILMLLSPNAGRTAPAFATGWTVAILIVALAVMLFVPSTAALGEGGGGKAVGLVKLVIGALFLVMAIGQWRKRPGPGESAALPKWMAGIDRISPLTALGIGTALAALNPKNLSLTLAAGLSLARFSGGEAVTGLVVFLVLAASSVLMPVVTFGLFRDRMQGPLNGLKDWLTGNNATVMFVVLLVLGVVLIGKSLSTL